MRWLTPAVPPPSSTHGTHLPSSPSSPLRLLLFLLLPCALCLLLSPTCTAHDSHPSTPDGGRPARHPSAPELLRQLQQLRRERDEWQHQRAAIQSTLTLLQHQLDGSKHFPTAPTHGVELSEVVTPPLDSSSSSLFSELTIQLVDPHSLFPTFALSSVWQTLLTLLADNDISGAIRVTIARLRNPPSSSSPSDSTPDNTTTTAITATLSPDAAPPADNAPTPASESPLNPSAQPSPPPWSPTAFPPPHPDFPSLFSPAPHLPPYSPSHPPSHYQSLIRTEFLHAYGGYVRDAFPHDHYHPLARTGDDSYHMHLTLVDALDTLLLMNLTTHFASALAYLSTHLRFGHQDNLNVFETTIRVLGSLLACHHLTHGAHPFLLNASIALADHLLPAFTSPSGVPWGTISFGAKVVYNPAWAGGASTVAEVASIQLEFQYLSRVTGDARYEEAVDAVMMRVRETGVSVYPQFISVQDGRLQGQVLTLGARVDSLYECLLKQYLMTGGGGERELMRRMWLDSGSAILSTLVMIALGDGTVLPYSSQFVGQRDSYPLEARLFVAEKHGDALAGKMDHLVCFLPGVYALSAWKGMCQEGGGGVGEGVEGVKGVESGCDDEEWMAVAKELALTCVDMYSTPTGLAPEIVQFTMLNPTVIDAQHQQALDQHRQLQDQVTGQLDALTATHDSLRSVIASNQSMTLDERAAALLSLETTHARDVATLNATLPPPPLRPRSPPFAVDPGAKYNLLRPETMESLFVLHRTTGEERWREWGWQLFSAFVRHARVEGGGYSGLRDVTVGEEERRREKAQWTARLSEWIRQQGEGGSKEAEGKPGAGAFTFQWSNHNDHMESFFLSETLKYAWLLFGEADEVSLDSYVFNTEAHPLPVSEVRREEEAVGYRKKVAPHPPVVSDPPAVVAPVQQPAPLAVDAGITAPLADVAGDAAAPTAPEGDSGVRSQQEKAAEGAGEGEGGGGGGGGEKATVMVATVAPTGEVTRDSPVDPSPIPPLPAPPSSPS